MIKDNVTIQISNGLETRPIAMLVQVASENVIVTADGADEQEAIQNIRSYLTQDK